MTPEDARNQAESLLEEALRDLRSASGERPRAATLGIVAQGLLMFAAQAEMVADGVSLVGENEKAAE